MYWIIYCKTDPPEYLRCDNLCKDIHKMTCAMFWAKYVNTVPPKWMWHDNLLKN